MNSAESVFYPSYYFRDMAFFLTKSITRIFDTETTQRKISIPEPPPLIGARCGRSSDDYFMEFALDDRDIFDSAWVEHLYAVIVRTIQLSNLDESVPIGTVVLLEMFKEFEVACRAMGTEQDELPPYPSPHYLAYFMGAFMLSYRILNQNQQPLSPEFWEDTFSGVFSTEQIVRMEDDFLDGLNSLVEIYTTTTYHNTSLSNPICDAYLENTTPAPIGDEIVCPPTNTLISPTQYTKAKRTMYAFVRVRMASRGREPVFIDMTGFKGVHPDIALSFPPCFEEMQVRLALLAEVKRTDKYLWGLDCKEVFEFLMDGRDRTDVIFENMLMGRNGLVEVMLREDPARCLDEDATFC